MKLAHSNFIKLIIIFLFFLPFSVTSQNIKGLVQDKDSLGLELAAVAVINPSDSLLVSYANTDKNGKFELTKIPKGKFIFQIHLVGYNTFQKIIDYQGKSMDMGKINLEINNSLDEVVLTTVIPIVIKKDTVSYNMKAFNVRMDDMVEDMLKKLPGVEVDVAGNIKAQGQDVNKVYVDGKEFFTGDPKVATKNLQADAVKTVSIIDEKSDKARVTGIGETEKDKVINLELKDDKKVNDFGKFQGGYGTDDRFLTSLNYNRFSPKIQASVFGKYNNINSSGSDISEIISFSSGSGGGGGGGALGMMMSFSSNQGPVTGFVTTGDAGLNLGYEIKKDDNLNLDYSFNYTNSDSGDVITKRNEIINNQEIYTDSKKNNLGINKGNRVNFSLINRSDKLSSLVLRGNLNVSNRTSENESNWNQYKNLTDLDLESKSNSTTESNSGSGNLNFNYVKRFNEKSKRNITFSSRLNLSNSSSLSSKSQYNRFYISNPSLTFEKDELSDKTNDTKNQSIDVNLEYTEPIKGNHFLELGTGLNLSSDNNDERQEVTVNGIVENPVAFNQFTKNNEIRGQIRYKYDNEKVTFTVGYNMRNLNRNFGLENTEEYTNHYTHFDPSINFRYMPKRGKMLTFNLDKKTSIPSVSQISPIVNNFNSLFISKGNPLLKPEKNYNARLFYLNHDFTSGFSMFSFLNYFYRTNTIINSQSIDNIGIRTSSFINSDDTQNLNANFNMGNRVKSLGIRYNFSLGGSMSNSLSSVNNVLNKTKSKQGNFGLSLENNVKDHIDISGGVNFSKNFTTVQAAIETERSYTQQSYYVKSDWNITKRFNFNTQFKYDIYDDSNFGDNQTVPIWNASLSYYFLKSKRLQLNASVLDILNKNVGIERNSSDNYYEEITSQVLGTYYMLSLTYNLKDAPQGTNNARNSMRMGRSVMMN